MNRERERERDGERRSTYILYKHYFEEEDPPFTDGINQWPQINGIPGGQERFVHEKLQI